MVELTAEELQRLRVVVAGAMNLPIYEAHAHQGNHQWLDNPDNYPYLSRDDRDGRFILWTAPQTDGQYWSPVDDPAQIGPMLEHFRALWKGTGQRWEIQDREDSWHVYITKTGRNLGFGEASTLECAIALAIAEYVGKRL